MWLACYANAGPSAGTSLSSRLALGDTELLQWQTVAETMATGLNPQTGLFEQFAGFFDLEEIDLTAYEGRSVPMDVVLGRERTQKTKVIKQADVVALSACYRKNSLATTQTQTFATMSHAAAMAVP
jgi:Trehalose and maltose hydrolases (possible phosphorylases)